jgi:glycosyltransferase EpsD
MAAGLPVVSLDGGGNKDILHNGQNGYIIEQQNIEEFSNRIREVVNNKEIENNCITFSKEFDIAKYVYELLKLYKD